jgi:hypothetical protein
LGDSWRSLLTESLPAQSCQPSGVPAWLEIADTFKWKSALAARDFPAPAWMTQRDSKVATARAPVAMAQNVGRRPRPSDDSRHDRGARSGGAEPVAACPASFDFSASRSSTPPLESQSVQIPHQCWRSSKLARELGLPRSIRQGSIGNRSDAIGFHRFLPGLGALTTARVRDPRTCETVTTGDSRAWPCSGRIHRQNSAWIGAGAGVRPW